MDETYTLTLEEPPFSVLAGTYQLTLDELSTLADAVSALDGHPGARELVEKGHAAIRRALGPDVGLIYAEDDADA